MIVASSLALRGSILPEKPNWRWLKVDLHYNDGPPNDTAIPADELRTVVREALQNSIDEIDRSRFRDLPTRVRLGVRQLTGKQKSAFIKHAQLTDLVAHLRAPTIGGLKKGKVSVNLEDPDVPLNVFRYEDSRTKGLRGDQFNPRSNFYSLLKSSGETMKLGGGGSHGKGKTVWSRSSHLRSFLIHSITDEGESRVFGLCRRDAHELDQIDYRGIAMFSVPKNHKGQELESFADGRDLGDEALAALQLEKELVEESGLRPPGTVFVVPGFRALPSRASGRAINQELVRIVGAEYWPALVMRKVIVEVELDRDHVVTVDLADPAQEHDPEVVALAESCLEAMAGRVQLRELEGETEAGIPTRFNLALEVPKTESLIEIQNHDNVSRTFIGGEYEVAFVLNKDPRMASKPGVIATFRENGQIVERYATSVPEGVIGFVALGSAAREVAPELEPPREDIRVFGDLMIRLMEVAAHDKWAVNGRHEQLDQYFPKEETRTQAGQAFERFRNEVIRKSRVFAGKFDDEVNEMVRDLTRYPGPGTVPPPPPDPKLLWSIEQFTYDEQHNAHFVFVLENRTSSNRDAELSVCAESDPPEPLPWSRATVRAEYLKLAGQKGGRTKNSPACSFKNESVLRVTVPAKKSVKLSASIPNDLNRIPVDLTLTRLEPLVRDLGA
jgi:hypothetical protein